MLRPVMRNIMRNVMSGAFSQQEFFAPVFSSSSFGLLTNRAIDPDSDIDIEFYTPSSFGVLQQVISQNVSASSASAEFVLEVATTGTINFRIGGSTLAALTVAQGSEPETLFRVQLVGTSFKIWKTNIADTDTPIRTASFARGLVREPLSQTVIGAYTNGVIGTYTRYFFGIQRNVKINGVLWKMDQRDELIQPSIPSGNNMVLTNISSWVKI